jgi:SCY1-like protein 1
VFFGALRDSFTQTRISSLMALSATADFYKTVDCATKIVPSISYLLVDPDKHASFSARHSV